MADPMQGATDKRVERTRRRVIEAAQRMLTASGPQAITYSALAEESGVGRATLYRHWPTIDDLWADVADIVTPGIELEPSGDLRSDLMRAMEVSVEIARSEAGRASLANLLQRAQWDDETFEFANTFSSLTPIGQVVRHGITSGQLPDSCAAETYESLLLGPLVLTALRTRGEFEEGLACTIVDFFMSALEAARTAGP